MTSTNLLLALVQSVVPSLLALGVARMSFRWASKKEHDKWVLDNKKAEWKELLTRADEIADVFPPTIGGDQIMSSAERVLPILAGVIRSLESCLFIWDSIKANDLIAKWRWVYLRIQPEVDMWSILRRMGCSWKNMTRT